MRSSGKVLLGFLALAPLFVGCSSLTPASAGVGFDAKEGSKIAARGAFFVTDLDRSTEHSFTTDENSGSSVLAPGVRTDISCRIFRVRPQAARNVVSALSEGDSRNLELQGSVRVEKDSTAFVLNMSYRRQPTTSGTKGQGVLQEEQITKSLVSYGGITLSDIDPKAFKGPVSLPFQMSHGTWEGISIRVQCTRDESLKDDYPLSYFLFGWLGWGSSHRGGEKVLGGITAFRSPSQVFQIVDASDRVLGNVSKREYLVFDTVPTEKIKSMIALLGIIRSIQLFYDAVYDYRSHWGPETGENVLDGRLPDFEFLYR